jgi:hypothetical protein
VPPYALVSRSALEGVEAWLGSDEDITEERLNELFERFEREQPVLAERIGGQLARTRDEVGLALGYFLSLVIWLAFDNSFSAGMRQIGETDINSVEEALTLDEELRGADPAEAVDSDDVVAMEQPHVVGFVNEHIEAALEVHAATVDVAAVHAIYRIVLIEVLTLSYAVTPIGDTATSTSEIHA